MIESDLMNMSNKNFELLINFLHTSASKTPIWVCSTARCKWHLRRYISFWNGNNIFFTHKICWPNGFFHNDCFIKTCSSYTETLSYCLHPYPQSVLPYLPNFSFPVLWIQSLLHDLLILETSVLTNFNQTTEKLALATDGSMGSLNNRRWQPTWTHSELF